MSLQKEVFWENQRNNNVFYNITESLTQVLRVQNYWQEIMLLQNIWNNTEVSQQAVEWMNY